MCMLLIAYVWPLAAQQPLQLTVKADEIKASVSPQMWGIFFEDINFAADGGLYAELVKNRSFEFNTPLMGWQIPEPTAANGKALVVNRAAENAANPRFARVTVRDTRNFVMTNEGFRGMGIHEGEVYHFSMYARQQGAANVKVRIALIDEGGKEIGSAALSPSGKNWQLYKASFTAKATTPHAKLQLQYSGPGVLDVDMISLFPQHTWQERPNGLRADLVQLLADLHPGFIRFPGGCIVEGRDLNNRYQWKKTVGATDQRELIINRWNTEFKERAAPDYFQSFGLGFYEYFQLAEDIGAAPLPILNCGMACQYNSGEVAAIEQLDPYIQDALDLIEFANGAVSSTWGALRAKMGHPEPFNLQMIGIGNEQWGPQYIERYTLFAKAIKSKHPEIRLVNSLGPGPDGAQFNFLNDTLRKLHADILDEHYYRSPEWFLKNAARYDQYDRQGAKIFAGEYAAHSTQHTEGEQRSTWECALAEAAFMTGLERNADVVAMASYAPLLAHVDAWQWAPDLIWFDNLRAYGTPSYYVQQLYARNRGSKVVPILQNGKALTGQDSVYASAVVDNNGDVIVKLVNTSASAKPIVMQIQGGSEGEHVARLNTLQNDDLQARNSLDHPVPVSPMEKYIVVKDNTYQAEMLPHSFYVLRVGGMRH